jgi:ribosomal protein L18
MSKKNSDFILKIFYLLLPNAVCNCIYFKSIFRLVIEQSNKHWNAYIEHFEGGKVITASTKEWAIKQFLRSTSDSNAAAAIGKVLAQRCLECGLLEVHSDYDLAQASPKVSFKLESNQSHFNFTNC